MRANRIVPALAVLVVAGWACASAAPGPAEAAVKASLQSAIDAAAPGATVRIGRGTFEGGITIRKSVSLVGSGPAVTIIRGGAPVITIGDPSAAAQPSVSIRGVTITGGLNGPNATGDGGVAAGGGVAITPGARGGTGATVMIADSVIAANRVTPSTASASPNVAFGAGIDNFGRLTVVNTRIAENVAGSTTTDPSVATYAAGGGLYNHSQGTLTLLFSVVVGNRAAVSVPYGKYSDGGGIVNSGALSIRASAVNENSSVVESDVPGLFPIDVEQEANAGGIYLPGGSTARIVDSTVSDNVVSSLNLGGLANAQAGGIDADGTLLMSGTTVDRNEVLATVPPDSESQALAIDGGIQAQGTVTVLDGRVSANRVTAIALGGVALAASGGVESNEGTTRLQRLRILGNVVTATGSGGLAHGGGVSNYLLDPGNPPHLTILDSVISANKVVASPPITIEGGGGLWSNAPLTLMRTTIAGNQPDQCVGCQGAHR